MLFEKNIHDDPAISRRYAIYEIIYTLIDFAAAILFVIGSIMFFSDNWQTPGTWMFLIGSIFFATKPTLRVVRELHLAAMGREDRLAQRFEDEG